ILSLVNRRKFSVFFKYDEMAHAFLTSPCNSKEFAKQAAGDPEIVAKTRSKNDLFARAVLDGKVTFRKEDFVGECGFSPDIVKETVNALQQLTPISRDKICLFCEQLACINNFENKDSLSVTLNM